MASTLTDVLRGLPDEGLAALFRMRPDLVVPPPSDMSALAARAQSRPSVARVLATAMAPRTGRATPRDRFDALSERERTVLRSVAQGYSGTEIARQLGVSTKTVDAYKHRIHDKVGLQHRTEYVQFAIAAQILGA